MVIHRNTDSSSEPCIRAQSVVANFLQQPITTITCSLLAGGSQEDDVVRCTYQDSQYVVKLFNNFTKGTQEIAWTKLASELAIGPKYYFADPAGEFLIMEYVVGKSLQPVIVNDAIILKTIAQHLSLLHNSSAPFAHVAEILPRIQAKYIKLKTAGGLHLLLEKLWQYIQKLGMFIESAHIKFVPCHNDLNPGNVFIDNQRVVFIDWGDSSLSNSYYDVAAFFILNAIEEKQERLFLQYYDAKLLESSWQVYIQAYKNVVRFEFALNLLTGVQMQNPEILQAAQLPSVEFLNHYVTLLAAREVKIDALFLYSMAIASLNEIKEIL